MLKIVPGIAVAIFALLIGIASSSLWRRLRFQSHVSIARSVIPRRTYERVMHFDAAKGSLWELRSSDGREFKRWTISCRSPEGARKEMNELLKTASFIFSREPVLGPLGEDQGEEVIAVFPASDHENGVASLFLVGKSEYLLQVTSESLGHVVDFRDDNKRNR